MAEQIIIPPSKNDPLPNSNSKTWYEGLPVWLKAALLIGPTALIALGLTYRIPIQIDGLTAKVEAHAALASVAIQTNQISQENEEKVMEEILRLLRSICSNTSRTEEARSRCF